MTRDEREALEQRICNFYCDSYCDSAKKSVKTTLKKQNLPRRTIEQVSEVWNYKGSTSKWSSAQIFRQNSEKYRQICEQSIWCKST